MLAYLRSVAAAILRPLRRNTNAAVAPLQTFRYRKPGANQQGSKEIVLLARTPCMRAAVHVIRKGGEENLHSHKTVDGFWMVLRGRIRFYGDNNTTIGEFGPSEGVLIPRHTRYWFESVGDQDAEMLQVLSFAPGEGQQRDNHEAAKFEPGSLKWQDGRTAASVE